MTAAKTIIENLLEKMPGGKVLDVATGKANFAFTMERCFTNCSLIVAVDTAALSLISMVKERKSRKITPSAMDGALLAFHTNVWDALVYWLCLLFRTIHSTLLLSRILFIT